MSKPNLILLGAPGSGKGTQAKKLVDELGYNHVSTGDLLRAEISKGSDLGEKVQGIMESGALVDDQTVLELLKANCDLDQNSYIFDGFPRNLEQANMLDEQILNGREFLAVLFNIDDNVIVERVVNRRLAKKSGMIYNLVTKPPKVEGKCDVSGEDLIHRPDDKEDVVRRRLNVFHEAVDPMVDFYLKLGKFEKVDASLDEDELFSNLSKLLE